MAWTLAQYQAALKDATEKSAKLNSLSSSTKEESSAALAAKERGRFVVNVQCDVDINYAPSALWTAAHHELPMHTVMHNNRAWHQELMFLDQLFYYYLLLYLHN